MDPISKLEFELLLNRKRILRMKRFQYYTQDNIYIDSMTELLLQNNNIKDMLLEEYRKITLEDSDEY